MQERLYGKSQPTQLSAITGCSVSKEKYILKEISEGKKSLEVDLPEARKAKPIQAGFRVAFSVGSPIRLLYDAVVLS
jgi:hypothetical protein